LSTFNLEPVQSVLLEQPATAAQVQVPDALERAAGYLLLAVTAPVTAVSAATVALLSRRTPFVAHLRVGKDDQSFWMWKLRTMWDRNEPPTRSRGWIEYIVAEPAGDGKPIVDSRVTSKMAAFFRRHSIDELPQLWNVARGEMALVGPRPLTRGELVRHYGARSSELLSVKPGLTGLWQVSGRSHIRFPQRARMDLALVRTLTPRMYLTLLFRTISALIYANGAW
jgi:exopolysaccharide production protein ExoY